MGSSEHIPQSGVTVGRVDNDQDTQERVLADYLVYLKGVIRPLLAKVGSKEEELQRLKEEGRKLVAKAHAAFVLLGKSEKEAAQEIAKWRL